MSSKVILPNSTGENEFTYVLIPSDDALPLKELSTIANRYIDTLKDHLKKHFAGGSLTNMDELRSQYGSQVDEKMSAFQACADEGVVEVLPLVRTSKTTLPLPNVQTAFYYDEMGALKERPPNARAMALAKQCGLDLEHPLLGDVFVGRVCCDPGPVSVSIGVHELDSSSPWVRQAPAENAAWKSVLSEFGDIAKSKAVGAKTAEQEEEENIRRGWRWTQSETDVEVTVTLPEGTTKSGVAVTIGRSLLRVALKSDSANPLVNLKLHHTVDAEESTWTMGSDERGPHVQVTLAKENETTWSAIEAKR